MTCACNRWERAPRRSSAAFTLVETLLGSVLAVIVFGALLLTIAYGFAVMRNSSENNQAAQIILGRLEGLRLYNWDQLVSSNMIPGGFRANVSPGDPTGANGWLVFTNTVTITNVALAPAPSYAVNMRQVTVTVTWSSDGVAHQRSMTTFVSQNGIQNYAYSH